MTTTTSTNTEINRYLKSSLARNGRVVVRDNSGRTLLVKEEALDFSKITKEGKTLLELGRRIRLMSCDMKEELATYIVPNELTKMTKDNANAADGVSTPLGVIINDHGLYLKYRPGVQEVGVNDRDDIMLRLDSDVEKDPTIGPVLNSFNTIITGRAKRLVTRTDINEHKKDIAEADAWLKALAAVEKKKTLSSKFKCAGIDYEQKGNVNYLYRTTRVNFFDPNDTEQKKLGKEVAERFKKVGRSVPSVRILSMIGAPRSEAEYQKFQRNLKKARIKPEAIGLPKKLSQSQFYDPETKGLTSSNFLYLARLKELPEKITIITVNTDYHGEVKSRGVLSPLMAIMSLIDVISAHCGAAVLNQEGTATTFTGPTGTGKTTAGAFWSEKNEKYRRRELRRRYEIDFKHEHPDWSKEQTEAKLNEIMNSTAIMCQEDWIEILETSPGKWMFWPTERTMYARTGGFPGLKYILKENQPLLENATADFGGSGDHKKLGRITHDYFPERLFYDPEWGHLFYDRSPRAITANVFLERNAGLDFIGKRVSAQEAMEWLLIGRTPAGKYEPLYNAYPDFSGLLMANNVVGDKLVNAYKEAGKKNFAPIGGGDASLGETIYEKLSVQMRLWKQCCEAVPSYIVNGAPGLEITQDVNWMVSEHPEAFNNWQNVSTEDFKRYMKERYGVEYGKRGEWLHVVRD